MSQTLTAAATSEVRLPSTSLGPGKPDPTYDDKPDSTYNDRPGTPYALWTGRFLSGFAVLFLVFDATIKLLQLPVAQEGTAALGYRADTLLTIGLIQVACLIVYLIPRTSILGAILWTGYLGGAIATHLRVGNPLFSHVLFPTYVAALLWGGLWLRDRRLRVFLS
jgi:hypothetical protein